MTTDTPVKGLTVGLDRVNQQEPSQMSALVHFNVKETKNSDHVQRVTSVSHHRVRIAATRPERVAAPWWQAAANMDQ